MSDSRTLVPMADSTGSGSGAARERCVMVEGVRAVWMPNGCWLLRELRSGLEAVADADGLFLHGARMMYELFVHEGGLRRLGICTVDCDTFDVYGRAWCHEHRCWACEVPA